MASRITLDIDGRVVYWDVDVNVAALLAQNLVQGLGPADGELSD
jgi:hypothetical protein